MRLLITAVIGCHCDLLHHLLRLVIPELLLGLALDLGHDELHVLGNQLALLPGHWLARVGACPNLEGDMKNSLVIRVV